MGEIISVLMKFEIEKIRQAVAMLQDHQAFHYLCQVSCSSTTLQYQMIFDCQSAAAVLSRLIIGHNLHSPVPCRKNIRLKIMRFSEFQKISVFNEIDHLLYNIS